MLVRAAGAVAWRPGSDGAEILLVHRAKYDDWSLPKGKMEPGEPLPATASREVLEETGARITLGRRLAPARYKVNGNPKQVDWWAARVGSMDPGAVPNREVDQVAWMSLTQALSRVSYKQDVSVLSDFAARPADTVPLVVLRHATALPRSEWRKDDINRPLDKAGTSEAAALAPLLSCFAPDARIVTSPAVRCVDTIRPYADLAGAPVRAVPALSPPADGRAPARNGATDHRALLFELIAARAPAIVCAHRENLPALLDAALAVAEVADEATAQDAARTVARPLPKAAFLVLHLSAGTLVAIDRFQSD
jgi:8-oxo-dGTP diphosphatase